LLARLVRAGIDVLPNLFRFPEANMTRFLALSLMLFGLFIASVGCGGGGEPTVITPEAQPKGDIELEMESAEYEKAMNEMQ
jgi:hypothetical protein